MTIITEVTTYPLNSEKQLRKIYRTRQKKINIENRKSNRNTVKIRNITDEEVVYQ